MMLLTVAVEADRTGKRYGGKLDPDEEIAANNPRVVGDPQMTRAIEWLTSQRCSP
jgi:hypothetical protein